MSPNTLRARHPRRFDVPLVAATALGALLTGIWLPALVFDNLFGDDTFSVLSGIWGFFESGNLLLALLLFGFSVLFPIAKLIGILVLWFVPVPPAARRAAVDWLEVLGKWSLLDAFVISVVIGTVQLGWLSEARAEPGAYVYLAAILLSLVATLLLRSAVGEPRGSASAFSRGGMLVTVPAAVLYGAGLSLPLLDVEKGWFWGHRYSLLRGIRELLAGGEWLLGLALAVFVVVLPSLRLLALCVLRAVRSADPRWRRLLAAVDRWSMLDVFALALLVVFTKLGSLATPKPLVGMWLLVTAAFLSAVDSVWVRRARRS